MECHRSAQSDPADGRSLCEGPCEPPAALTGEQGWAVCSLLIEHTHSFPWALGLCQGERPEPPGPHGHAGTLQCPQPSPPGSPGQATGEPGDAGDAREGRQHTPVELWLLPQRVCPPTYQLRGSKELCWIQKRGKNSGKKKIFPLLPTLEKYAQVMSLVGISQCWEPGKPGCGISMPPALMKCPAAAAAPGHAQQPGFLLNTLHLQSHQSLAEGAASIASHLHLHWKHLFNQREK